ncbi:MAG: sulfatase [Planctomycetota bacterium]|nr:sulfatase [Planctomycetota bacterium]
MTLRAVFHAAILAGFALGTLDGIVIALGPGLPGGLLAGLGCITAGIASYVLAWVLLMLALSPIVHLGFKHTPLGVRARHAFALALAAGVFVELYWWTRPFVFYGKPFTSPERLFSGVVMLVASYAIGILLARAFAARSKGFRFAWEGAAFVTLLIGALYHVAAPSGPGDRGALNERNQDLPNVLLVVVDALRADVLGAYGNTQVSSPVIDDLARKGVVFENAQAQAPFTWTSFGSILTGKYPRRHGLMKMKPGVRMAPNETLAWHLKQAVFAGEAAGKQLQPDDFASGTFMTGTLSQGSGLMRGFDVYFEALVGHELVDSEEPWSVYRSDLLLFKFKNKLTQAFDSSLVVSTARDWLREHEGRRFMAMVHLYSTHTPYDPEPRFRDMYVDPDYDGPIHRFDAYHRIAIEKGDFVPTPADVEQIKNLYYGGVSQADDAIGQVLAELERAGSLDNTLVIITSDHGESLGDDEFLGETLWEHNWMYETNLEVPLIMTWPKGLPAGRRVDAIVETVDIVPTICDLMGLESPRDKNDPERGFVDGHSLAPLARGEVFQGDRWDGFAFAENGQYISIRDRDWKLVVERNGLGEEAWAENLAPGAPGTSRPRLFHLAVDPKEDRDVIDEHPEQAARLLGELRVWSDSMPVPISDVVKSDRDLEHGELLGDLGYADGIGMEDEAPE